MFAYAVAEDVTLRIDGTETQVRRPQAHCPGRWAFVSGKRKQDTIKATTISDHQGRTLWSGAPRPGRMDDQTAVRTEGIAERFRRHPSVQAEVDEGYRGLANEFPDQVSAPPKKPKDFDYAPLTERYRWREMRRRQSSRRICVEHANAETRQWRPLQRYIAAARTTATPIRPSPASSPTAPPSGSPGTRQAPTSYSSARRPADSSTNRSPRPARPNVDRGATRKLPYDCPPTVQVIVWAFSAQAEVGRPLAERGPGDNVRSSVRIPGVLVWTFT
ncbi:transposase family protein [Streptomyces sp. NPDC048623]|uniref:transposase family protein n=1 Tax=Streptomyces sp. NPDC048623 TaxID=3155761 RepID=UPI00342AFCF8